MSSDVTEQSRAERVFAQRYDRMNAMAERRWLGARRAGLVADVRGPVVEIGAGTGANLPYYTSPRRLVLTEPSAAMRAQLEHKLAAYPTLLVEVVDATAEALPLPDASVDTVVCTLVLCTVDDPARVLAEIRRVLTPGGSLRFLEHVRGGRLGGRLQDAVTPLIRRVGAGCHPNRDTAAAIRAAGFTLRRLETFKPVPRIPLLAPFITGTALPPDRQ
jgi:ubiquinone/menaquinone biosynthesis C-methylase UbiE